MAWNGRFHENVVANPSGPKTYPWCCYPLNDGRYVEEGPLEWRNASFWIPFGKIISQVQRHLNGPKKARNVKARVQKSMKTSPNVFYKESVHIQDVAKKLTRALKIVCYDPRKWPEVDIFRENALLNSKPFWPRDLRLVVLCIKLWWVHVGGTVSVEIHHCVFRLVK
jgi:hypothetical protein